MSFTLDNIQEIRQKIVDSLKKGQYKAGLQCLQILKSNLADTSPYLARNLAHIANQIVDRQLKLDLLKEALDLIADDAFVLTSYGNALAKDKQFEEAFLMFKRALRINKNSDIIFNVYAKALAENEQLEQAAQTFERALQINGQNPVTLANYGKLLLENKQVKKAVVILEKSLALNNHAMALTHYGQALAALGEYEQAFETFEQALQLDAKNRWVWSIYGEHLAKHNQLEKSKQIFERALDFNPQSIVILASYGKVLAKNGQPEEGIQVFRQALLIEPRDEQDAEIFEQLLRLEPTNTKLLADYGQLLVKAKKFEKASQMFQKSLNIDPRNASAWSDYGRALAELGQLQAAADKFDRALQLKPDDVVILTTYAKVLLDDKQSYKALRLLEHAKQIEPENVIVLHSYAHALVKDNRPHEALQMFERILEIEPENVIVLNRYAQVLAMYERSDEAYQIFERILEIEPDNVIVLNSYATALAKYNDFDSSFEKFEKSLRINNKKTSTLNSYGTALAKNNQFDEACQQFERSLNIEPNNITTLNNYSNVLADNDKLDEACQLLEHALEIEPDNTRTLNQYGTIMTEQGRVENAKKIFEHSLQIEPDNPVTLILYAVLLEVDHKYEAALEILHKISLDRLNNHFKSYIYLNLGRLYYLIYQEKEGDWYFDLAIENSPRDDLTRIKAARHILAVRPYSKDGIKYLRKITIASPRYEQALSLESLNSNLEAYFDMFKDKAKEKFKEADLFRKIIDHKIKNQLSTIKGFIERIRIAHPSQTVRLKTLIEKIDQILEKMSELNKKEEARVTEMSHDDYKKQLEVLSQIGHHKADFINNKLAAIKSKVQRYMYRLNDNDAYYKELSRLLKKIENTQKNLNKLKSINEGVKIERRIFKVKDLFTIWKEESIFKQATIHVDIQNEEAEFYGDQLEIIDCIKELVENASAHNRDKTDLRIEIICKDVKGLPQDVRSPTIKDYHRVPNEKKYLAIIVSDNGEGVSPEKKELIFLMNYTTSTTGSGLGLFYIKKTVTAMKGYIVEKRKNKEDGSKSQGAKFEIYLPYHKGGVGL